MDATGVGATNDRDHEPAIVFDYRARASLGQLPLAEQQAIKGGLRALAHDGWDLNNAYGPSLLSVVTLRDPRGARYVIRLKAAPDVEVVLRPLPGDPGRMAVADVLNYEALRNVAAPL